MPVPHFEIFSVKKSPTRMAKKVNYPCVLKPVFLAASRGVSRADNPRQFKQAVEDIKSVLADTEAKAKAYGDEDKQVLVEDYIPGVEVALE
ncbi:ATP-grasp domain-containing protein, partial [Candidatus Saccharibacteria bacterium]|nr:ATP-grasp domain-containing protein [Calditrichia bacterium]NIV98613.1 ATP-grasp domain-containing protein [Candidatus Saccharibacteria bacterium]NIW79470.1 ATP-grasp domain-containing protein [Calditrichia bacterium]